MTWLTDEVRAALIALAKSAFPVLLILGVVNFTAEEIGYILVFLEVLLTTLALIFKTGQGQSLLRAKRRR